MLTNDGQLLIAKNSERAIYILPAMANRHGLVTGATGTGKTVSLQVIAESMSALGIPVLVTDIKGDVSGIALPGSATPKIGERVEALGLAADGFAFKGSPVCFWDIFGTSGHPLRTTISEMGPILLARVLDLNDTQAGVLHIVFTIADDQGLALLDLKDLRKMIEFVSEKDNRRRFSQQYGNLAPATLAAIQRGLVGLEQQGGDTFFGEPALRIDDFMRFGEGGRGMVNIMAADALIRSPRLYAAFLLWLLSEFFEDLPEIGDPPKPKLVLFFDEAHLLFANAPKALVERIEQVVRLIRSKGVGVFFITQNPADIPESVLAQLGNRVQHALRAYTPSEQRAVRAAADAFRPNPAFKTVDAIGQLAVGEALVSILDAKGVPEMVQRATMLPPESRIGPLSADERRTAIAQSALKGKYDTPVDRESAYEMLSARLEEKTRLEAAAAGKKGKKSDDALGGLLGDLTRKTAQSISRNVANQVGRSLARGILGSLFGGRG